jgi:hypothetical protein
MLGRRVLVGVANRGQRVSVLLGQRGVCGEVEGRSGQGVKVCSSLLEGKEELGVEKALFNFGLSASCVIAGEADMAVACVSKRLVCDGAAEYGAWRQVPEKLFPDCGMGGRVYMAKQAVVDRRRLPVHCLLTQTCSPRQI